MTERVGLYPGTFDPVTLGHADIIRRGAKLVDRLIVGVTTNSSKNPMFTSEERIEMVRAEIARQGLGNVEVEGFDALLMKFAESLGASVIVRGLRAVADVSLQPIASRLVKEIALFGGDIGPFVSPAVREQVIARVEEIGRKGNL